MPRPRLWDSVVGRRSPAPVVGCRLGAQQTFCRRGVLPVKELPDTLLGFETTSLWPLRGWVVVAPSLVVGCVVFDSWIVVASISQIGFLPSLGVGSWFVDVQFLILVLCL